jgi:hypothetical protein
MKPKLTIPEMLSKLDNLYNEKEKLESLIKVYVKKLEQLEEDIELAEQMIMYSSNKKSRGFL